MEKTFGLESFISVSLWLFGAISVLCGGWLSLCILPVGLLGAILSSLWSTEAKKLGVDNSETQLLRIMANILYPLGFVIGAFYLLFLLTIAFTL